jgi:DNA segregation ATPase FtsK/SpoIIIE-like protein
MKIDPQLLEKAKEDFLRKGKITVPWMQSKYKIGYALAMAILEAL